MKVLIVKISSMGDLIQLLPALTDVAQVFPDVQFDWVVEEPFIDVPSWHPNVNQIIPIALRRWKKNVWKNIFNGQILQFIKKLRANHYDYVIDAQSNLKSAIVTFLSKGKRFGVDKESVHEKGIDFAYDIKINIQKNQHHALRMRQLFSKVFNYSLANNALEYGVDVERLPAISIALPERFIFITHMASRSYKLWPEPYWATLIKLILKDGYDVVLPWWSSEEKIRAQRLSEISPKVHLIPPMSLSEKMAVIAKARAAVSCDTGLAHMAASLKVPNVVLYGPMDPYLVGTAGPDQIHLQASFPPCVPCARSKCHFQGEAEYFPACMASITPSQVYQQVRNIIATEVVKSG